ncbi:MAG TPA: formylmethanofuran dehydrogenase subunit B [candidate division Zixibacteria bacterium]|nr:formylmethanofuran dehydrogenase subunit B [candidate division Zixibacteria bacterium]
MKAVKDVVCPFCGSLCDDIEVVLDQNKIIEVRNACNLGAVKIAGNEGGKRILQPLIKKEGKFQPVSYDEAAEKAAEILLNSDYPIFYGFGSTEAEAHKESIKLAEEVGAIWDHCPSVCHGPSIMGIQEVGLAGCTLGEIRNRSDLIIYLGCNPMEAHPRHMSRYTTFPRGYFREKGFQERTVVVIDIRYTETAKLANHFLQIEPDGDFEFISALRAIVNGRELKRESVSGIPIEKIKHLADLMKKAKHGIVFFGLGLATTKGKHRNVDAALSLVRDLNDYTKFYIMPLRGHYNVTGAQNVITWIAGYPFAVSLARGYPQYNPGEFSMANVFAEKEVDAAVIVASDPVGNSPRRVMDHFAKIPVISLDPYETPTTRLAEVVFPVTISGVESEGTAYRMDSVPIRLRKVKNGPKGILSDYQVLKKISKKYIQLKKRKVKDEIIS